MDKPCHDARLPGLATMTISLPDPMKARGEEQARDGRHGTVSDYVRDLVRRDQDRRDQDRRQAIAELQAVVAEGDASGLAGPMDRDEFFARNGAH